MQRRQFLKNRKVGGDIIGNKIYYTTSDDNLIEFNDGGVISDNSSVNVTLKTRDGDKKVTVFDKPITKLNGTFTDLANITMVSIPESVKHISGEAFRNVGLEYVNIDNIGNWCNVSFASYSHPAFNAKYEFILYSNWKPVTDLIIPDSVISIGQDVFRCCTGLTSVTIPDSVTSIGNYAFENCTGLTSVTIPDSVTSIGDQAFENCTGLTSVTIPDSVTSIGNYAFKNCTGLTSVTISDGVTSIGNYAFENCTGLTSITIPDSMISIGSYAFYGCKNITTIIISEDSQLKSIGYYNFFDTQWYNNFPNGVVYLGNVLYKYKGSMPPSTIIEVKKNTINIGNDAFRDCAGLTSITIPDSMISIGNDAFRGCTGLTSITIPDGVTSIGSCAFMDCDRLTSITIPNSVTSIGDQAFYSCDSLTSITCNALTPPTIGPFTLYTTVSTKIYVPAESVEYYKRDKYWGFKTILPIQNNSTPSPSTPSPSTPSPSTGSPDSTYNP